MKKKYDVQKLHAVYMSIWKKRGGKSEVSGKPLGNTPTTLMFDHALEKHKYPHLVYCEWNIILCSPEEHELRTNGFPLKKHKELILKIKNYYEDIKYRGSDRGDENQIS